MRIRKRLKKDSFDYLQYCGFSCEEREQNERESCEYEKLLHPHGLKGRPYTREHNQNISLSKIGKPSSLRGTKQPNLSLALKAYYFNPLIKMFPEDRGFYMSSEWIVIRLRILLRDNYTCQICGAQECRLEVHHKIPRKVSHNDSDENLVTLCQSCHKREDRKILAKPFGNQRSLY